MFCILGNLLCSFACYFSTAANEFFFLLATFFQLFRLLFPFFNGIDVASDDVVVIVSGIFVICTAVAGAEYGLKLKELQSN